MRRCGGGDSGGGSRVLGAAGCGRGSACSPDGRGERGARGPGRGTVRTERRLPLSGSQGHPGCASCWCSRNLHRRHPGQSGSGEGPSRRLSPKPVEMGAPPAPTHRANLQSDPREAKAPAWSPLVASLLTSRPSGSLTPPPPLGLPPGAQLHTPRLQSQAGWTLCGNLTQKPVPKGNAFSKEEAPGSSPPSPREGFFFFFFFEGGVKEG